MVLMPPGIATGDGPDCSMSVTVPLGVGVSVGVTASAVASPVLLTVMRTVMGLPATTAGVAASDEVNAAARITVAGLLDDDEALTAAPLFASVPVAPVASASVPVPVPFSLYV